jgi:hypothetical protein
MITSIFDIDGTLANGYMITDFPQYLLKRGMFNGDIATEMENTLKALKSGIISYREAGLRVPGIYAAGIRGQEIKEVRDLAEDYLKGYMKNVFPFTTGRQLQ